MNGLMQIYGYGLDPPLSDGEIVTTAHVLDRLSRNQAYEQSPYGRINALLEAQTSRLEGASPFNALLMLLEGAKAANRWLGAAAGYGDRLQWGDMLTPLGLGTMAAPFVRSRMSSALGSRSANIYDPPEVPKRPFDADYPRGAETDETGRLRYDIEGRPLGAEIVVGRRVVGGEDEAFPPAQLDHFTTSTTGRSAEVAPRAQMGQHSGLVRVDRRSGRPTAVYLADDLTASAALRVHAHENAHIIDILAGHIPTEGLMTELRRVYHDLNDPTWRRGRPTKPSLQTTPEVLGYGPRESPRELIAEAIRAYMADPNYLKSVAPKTAARIRAFVNESPELSRLIQFNVNPMASLPGVVLETADER